MLSVCKGVGSFTQGVVMGVEGVGIDNSISGELKSRSVSAPRILLVDDDVIFGKIMCKIAQREGIPLTFYSSVKALGQLSNLQADVGLVDYDLGSITGIQLTDVLERYLQQIPIILISQYRHIGSKHWPNSVVDFVPKSVGSYGILNAAFRVHADRKALALPS